MLITIAFSMIIADGVLHGGGRACDEDMLARYWRALRASGVKTAEGEKSTSQNAGGVAEGGTDQLEFMEEVALVRDAGAQSERLQSGSVCGQTWRGGLPSLLTKYQEVPVQIPTHRWRA